MLFGGRRASLAPLVYQSLNWEHGVFVGASAASETTAAATGKVGVVRRDPMAMLPFCGYNMGDYWAHWISFGEKSGNLPKIFHVNWFRQDSDGKFIWPGFGENIRVLRWIIERCKAGNGNTGEGNEERAVSSPIGWLPAPGALDTAGLHLSSEHLRALTTINPAEWQDELRDIAAYFDTFGERLPPRFREEVRRIKGELEGA
jgi:phosphoenolpyruvate carboxykinase (GTP)